MNLDQQVCSLQLANRLKELGIKQDSLFYWINPEYTINNVHTIMYIEDMYLSWPEPDFYYSAFTVAELADILPNCITIPNKAPFDNYRLIIRKFITVDKDKNQKNDDLNTTNNFLINYECDSTAITGEEAWLARKLPINIYDPNLANAMAKMIIYLYEEGLLRKGH